MSARLDDAPARSACRVLARGVALAALASALVGASPATVSGLRHHEIVDRRRGLDLSQFRRTVGTGAVVLSGDEQHQLAQRQDACAHAFDDALRKVQALEGLRYGRSIAYYRDALRQTGARAERMDPAARRRDIVELHEWATEDPSRREYTCYYELGVRVEPRLEELDGPFDAAVQKYLSQLPEGDTLNINLADALDHLLQDPEFRQRVKGVVTDDQRWEPFRYKDDDTQSFLRDVANGQIEISHYEVGQYWPNAVLTALIARGVRPKVMQFLERYKRVGVRCIGSADRLPIRRGLAYAGRARLLEGERGLELNSSSGRLLSPVLRNNDELSFARAYEALAVLAHNIPKPERLSLRYLGRGEASGGARAADPFSRKITFEIKGFERY